MTTARDREKKQLEEIAHLYFSSARKPHKEPPPDKQVSIPAPEPLARPLWICCRTGQGEGSQVVPFLLNLAILFKIAGEPALWISSDTSFASRPCSSSQSGFWPRVAGMAVAGVGAPFHYHVPMGIQIVVCSGKSGQRMECDEAGGLPRWEWGRGELSRVRYVFCNDPLGFLRLEDAHRLDVLLLSPATQKAVLALHPRLERTGPPAQAGVVAVGVTDEKEAEALFLDWQGTLDLLYTDAHKPEIFGFVPGDLNGHGAGRPRIEVLESPLSWKTRCLQRIASRIRGKREEIVQRSLGSKVLPTV